MSLDQTRDELIAFRRALDRFNSSLKAAQLELQHEHDRIAPLWRDSFRDTYDRHWEVFGNNIDLYLTREADRYLRFLDTKIRQIEAYLHG